LTDSAADASSHRRFADVVERRRSIYFYTDQAVPNDVVTRALRLAMLAPNHHRTAPWRFFVFAGDARERLAIAYEAAARRVGRDVERARRLAYAAPVTIAVACVPAMDKPKVKVKEEEFAVAAAAENLLLSLAAEGVGSMLKTGELVESDEVLALLGLQRDRARVMAVVNVGYRDPNRPLAERPEPDVPALVHWMSA
jgi:nitroreductase